MEQSDKKDRSSGGRPTKYKPEYAHEAYELCLLGATDKMLAEYFEVNEDTIKEWKKVHEEFSTKVKGGKLQADSKVAAALYKRAIGFKYNETTYEKLVTDDNADEKISINLYKKKVVTKLMAPDTGAAMNWLKNRQRELWRDNIDIDFNKLTDDQLDKIINHLTSKANL